MNSILRIYVPLTLNVAIQHTEVLTVTLDLTSDISKQPTHLFILTISYKVMNVDCHFEDYYILILEYPI